MSKNKEIIDEIIDYIDTSIHKGLDESDFIKEFRNKIDNYLKEKLS